MKQVLLELLRLKKQSLIAIGLLLLSNVVLYAFVSGYQESALIKARADWSNLRRRVAAADRGDVKVAYRQGKSDLERLRSMIPLKRQFPRVLGDVLDAAASSGVAIGSITYKPQVVKDEELLAYIVTMSTSGSYAALKSLLADLQKYHELVVIDGVSFANSDPYVENVSMELHLTVYLREGA
ncbi:MAG: type 4a pilus biogenesis protein PilO [Pedobacter sp.]